MHRDIIVVGASAGGVEALATLVSGLPDDLQAAVLVVLHMPPAGASVLPALLQRRTSLPSASAVDGESIKPGRIYVAPPGPHLCIADGAISLNHGPRENGYRPAVDVLFRTAARAYGPRVVGVVLSGALDDGAMGMRTIAQAGGTGIVQDPEDAAFPGMPRNALAAMPDAIRVPVRDIGAVLGEITRAELQVEGNPVLSEVASFGNEAEPANPGGPEGSGSPSVFTCPECHGTLFLSEEAGFTQYRCRVGHGFSAESLLASESDALEGALWSALRTLEERSDLLRRMAERSRRQGQLNAAERFMQRVRAGDRDAELLRQVLLSGETARDDSA